MLKKNMKKVKNKYIYYYILQKKTPEQSLNLEYCGGIKGQAGAPVIDDVRVRKE